jgi:hypothetical protein
VIVPLPSVVVVVVVVSETCAQAKGATNAKTKLSNIFFIVFLPYFPQDAKLQLRISLTLEHVPAVIHM